MPFSAEMTSLIAVSVTDSCNLCCQTSAGSTKPTWPPCFFLARRWAKAVAMWKLKFDQMYTDKTARQAAGRKPPVAASLCSFPRCLLCSFDGRCVLSEIQLQAGQQSLLPVNAAAGGVHGKKVAKWVWRIFLGHCDNKLAWQRRGMPLLSCEHGSNVCLQGLLQNLLWHDSKPCLKHVPPTNQVVAQKWFCFTMTPRTYCCKTGDGYALQRKPIVTVFLRLRPHMYF